MSRLITLQQAVDHLREDIDVAGSPEDPKLADLEQKVADAEGAIADYLEVDIAGSPTEWDPETVPSEVRQAVLLYLGWSWKEREGEGDDPLDPNGPIANLLRRRRPLAIA